MKFSSALVFWLMVPIFNTANAGVINAYFVDDLGNVLYEDNSLIDFDYDNLFGWRAARDGNLIQTNGTVADLTGKITGSISSISSYGYNRSYVFTDVITTVPEPSTFALLMLGLFGLVSRLFNKNV